MNELINKQNSEFPENEKINEDELDDLKKEDNLQLKPVKNSELNDDQQAGLAAMLDWLYAYKGSRNENAYFALRGSAGTGKTTLISYLLKAIDRNKYWHSKICICAPTHKAKKVIGNKTKWQNLETLQSLLGLKMDVNIENFDPNKPEFTQTGTLKIFDYWLVIIDESSMINSTLYTKLQECSKGCMILFVGDHVQLNPVKEYNISLALTAPIHSYTLTQPARQKVGNPLLDLLNILREDIENGTKTYVDILRGMPKNVNSEGEGYIMTNDPQKFADYMKEVFTTEEFKENKDFSRYIAWTNASITKTNRWIRKEIFGYKSTVEIGELLLSYRTVMEDDALILVNSDDYVVESVRPTIISDYSIPIQVEAVELRCIDTDEKTSILILEKEEQNCKNYTSVYDEFLTEAKAKQGQVWSKKFYPFKNRILVGDEYEFDSAMLKKEVIKKDFDYGYGITAHKSQGSTYNTVFVNHKDIALIVAYAKPYELKEAEAMKKRLLYVALSRASKIGYIIV